VIFCTGDKQDQNIFYTSGDFTLKDRMLGDEERRGVSDKH
jgi:hypothetical protein